MSLKVKEIVEYLDQHIVGQEQAKRRIASMIKNKIRRDNLVDIEWKKNIFPFNGILIGDTGVGKTEIFRRIAEILDVAFCKVDISAYTSSGYVGKDVDSIISSDLLDAAKNKVKGKYIKKLMNDERVLSIIAEAIIKQYPQELKHIGIYLTSSGNPTLQPFITYRSSGSSKMIIGKVIEVIRNKNPKFMNLELKVTVKAKRKLPFFVVVVEPDKKYEDRSLHDTVESLIPKLAEIEFEKMEDVKIQQEIREVLEKGIVFLDELDKIAEGREGKMTPLNVQKELLTLIEGKTVSTEIGPVSTDHILFIGAGAFKIAKPDDLLPELLGRMPVRIVLNQLTKEDMKRILVEPKYALIKKIKVLYESEGISVNFTEESIDKIAEIAYEENIRNENLGARRLQSIVAILIEDIDFEIEEKRVKEFIIDDKYIERKLKEKEEEIKKALKYIENKATIGFIT